MGNIPPIALRAVSLTKRFGDVTAVSGLSFDVRAGEIFGFLGPNGAGKTTTIKMMCGLLQPDSGSVEMTVGGAKASASGPGKGKSIGLSPQEIVVWEMLTCREQLEFIGRMYGLSFRMARSRSDELLETFGLAEKRNMLAKTLSGGLKRRLNIALALVHKPEILFLDEPQAGLDPQSRVLVRDYLKGFAGQKTIVLTTHDMEEAEKLADRVCIIDKGKLLVLGTVASIKSQLGEGDLFEIELVDDVADSLLPFLPSLGGQKDSVTIQGRTLTMVSKGAGDLITEILQIAKSRGLGIAHLRIRPKTLEDVFIKLTGRGLRE